MGYGNNSSLVAETELSRLQKENQALRAKVASLQGELAFKDVVLDTVDAIIVVLGGNGEGVYANRAFFKLSGLTPEIFKGLDIMGTPTLPEEEKIRYRERVARMVEGERPLAWDNEAFDTSGNRYRSMWTNTVILNDDGGLRHVIASGIDITELWNTKESLKLAKEEAEQATLLKDRFVSLVSHDIRGPVASTKSLLELFLAEASGMLSSQSWKEALRMAAENCAHAVKLANDLLDLGKIKGGKVVLSAAPVNVREMIKGVALSLEFHAAGKGVAVENHVQDNAELYCDRGLVGEVFRNLLSNAVKYCHKGGVVAVSGPGEDGAYAVKDTGIGMDPKTMATLFKDEKKLSLSGTANGNWERTRAFLLPGNNGSPQRNHPRGIRAGKRKRVLFKIPYAPLSYSTRPPFFARSRGAHGTD